MGVSENELCGTYQTTQVLQVIADPGDEFAQRVRARKKLPNRQSALPLAVQIFRKFLVDR